MNNLACVIYLADIVNPIKAATSLIALLTGIIASAGIIVAVSHVNDNIRICAIKMLVCSFICAIIALLTPSKEAIYLMTGVTTVQEIAATPEANKVKKILNLGLDKMINNLQESK